MGSRLTIACVLAVVLLGVQAPVGSQQNPYRLKEADQSKICLACHTDFEQKLKRPFVHSAVQAGECSGCHNPHASDHGKLLAGTARQICASCHERVIPANAKSAHKVVADGECQKCHDPHASDNAAILLTKGNELCVSCHKELGDAAASARFKHHPVGQGCVTCHDPHGSDQSVRLLKTAVPALCVKCHKADSPAFAARHKNYPVARASCTSCHDPHGSNQPALMLNNVHAPVSGGTCSQCHEAPGSATPFATKQPGYELCKGCHSDAVNAIMGKARLHWPVADKRGCVSCHNPHASKQANLLKASTPALCGDCHADTRRRIAATSAKHAPVEGGDCLSCHSPHGAAGAFLLEEPNVNTLCAQCHDYEQHSAHPIGEKAIDPRNKNLRVDCLSCHKAHGTEFKHMLLAATTLELCTGCHKKFAR